MTVEKPVLALSNRENPILVRTDHVMEAIRMCTQAYNVTLNEMLDANMGKFGCMSLSYGFMRLEHRGNNSDKKTLINIPYISWSY